MNKTFDWDDVQIRAWVAEGRNTPYIAATLGLPYDLVRRHIMRMGAFVTPAQRTHCPRRHHRYAEVGSTVTERGHRVCHACRDMHSVKCKQASRLKENRKRKARTAEIREMEALETCPAGHSKRWNTRADGQCSPCLRSAAKASVAEAKSLWTWDQWADQRDKEFATPAYLRMAPAIKEWLVRNKVQP